MQNQPKRQWLLAVCPLAILLLMQAVTVAVAPHVDKEQTRIRQVAEAGYFDLWTSELNLNRLEEDMAHARENPYKAKQAERQYGAYFAEYEQYQEQVQQSGVEAHYEPYKRPQEEKTSWQK